MIPYQAPEFNQDAFNCPICNAYSSQRWLGIYSGSSGSLKFESEWRKCICTRCSGYTVWFDGKMLYPDFEGVQLPNTDLGEDIIRDYYEAASILNKSPRGATALLRLCLQKLCKSLGQDGNNINNDIAALVKNGLPIQIQKALDILRVIGNNAVHPGQIDIRDDVGTATQLFSLLNFIADAMITQPKRIEEFYNTLPEGAIDAITKRDK